MRGAISRAHARTRELQVQQGFATEGVRAVATKLCWRVDTGRPARQQQFRQKGEPSEFRQFFQLKIEKSDFYPKMTDRLGQIITFDYQKKILQFIQSVRIQKNHVPQNQTLGFKLLSVDGRSVGWSVGVIGTLFHTLLRAHHGAHEFVNLFICLHLQ